MTATCFVDANVFVYMSDPRDPAKQSRAQAWVWRLWQERSGRTSMQALSEYYVIATRKLTPRVPEEEAWAYVQELLAWPVQPIDRTLMARAQEVERRYGFSWWDSMIVAAAQLQECRYLLTEDLQDGAVLGTVRVRNPFLHAIEEPEADYDVVPVALPLHRRPGRPKGRGRRASA